MHCDCRFTAMPRLRHHLHAYRSGFFRFLLLRWRLLLRSFSRSEARSNRLFRFGLAGLIGIGAGLVVALLDWLVGLMHHNLFALEGTHLSDADYVEPWRLMAMPVAGGLAVGAAGWLIKRWRP